ncbi:hypothetical protein ACQP2Y_22975 [Actinoplanes sp. CA-051413]|uniref:hypothetical protein n=1 Tax=Actinoplanes sp. CA-051413 TaxID=3239899 RepID=UPI003D95C380
MPRHIAAALTATALLLPLAACTGDSTTTDEMSYRIDESVTSLVIGARAASVEVMTGEGPVTVTEEHRYSRGRPTTAHEVAGTTLRLTESGCGDDDARCEVRYRIRMPAATALDITAQAGAIKVDGVAGDIRITTEAGAVEGRALTSDAVTVKTELGATSLEFAEAPALISSTSSMGAVDLRVPGTTTYAVDVRMPAGPGSVSVDRDPASAHRIEVRTEVGTVQIRPLP